MITPIQSKKRPQQKNTPGHRPPTAPANVSSKSQYILLLILILILQWDQTHPKLRVQGGVIATYVRYYKVHDNIRTPSQQSVVASSRTINTTTTAVLLLLRIASRGHNNSNTYVSYVCMGCLSGTLRVVCMCTESICSGGTRTLHTSTKPQKTRRLLSPVRWHTTYSTSICLWIVLLPTWYNSY